jgi:hypothetical protein
LELASSSAPAEFEPLEDASRGGRVDRWSSS